MKKQNLIVKATAVTVAAVFSLGTVTAADAKAQPKAAPAKAEAPAKPAPAPVPPKAKTMEEVFSFLPPVVATIGNKKITKQDFLKQLGNIPVEYLTQYQPEMLKAQTKQMIDELVKMEILLQLAEKAGFKPTKELVFSMIDKQFQALPKEKQDLFSKQLQMQKKTLDDLKQEMVKNPDAIKIAAIQSYVAEKVAPTVKITDADIEKYYREHQDHYKMPASVNASHILISNQPGNAQVKPDAAALAKLDTEAKAKAEKILAQLKQGADFGKLAEQESACPSGKRAQGNVGEFTQNGPMDPVFTQAAFALNKPGELSPVVKTQFGYHIIKLNSKKAASIAPLAQVKEQIRNELTSQAVATKINEEIDKAKKETSVTVAEIK